MKQSFKLLSLLALGTSVMTITGCQDYDLGLSVEEIQYKKNFTNLFGEIDAEQTWNLAQKSAITVTPGASSTIKIYAMNGATYQLVAKYDDVQSTRTLQFDAVAGTNEVLVSDGLTSQHVNVDGSVSFASSTRAIHEGSRLGISVSEMAEYKYFPEEAVTNYTKVAPEGGDNTKKVTCNFTLTSNGSFTIYPIYLETSSWSTIGVYYRDVDQQIHTVDVYTSKHGDDYQYWDTEKKAWTSWTIATDRMYHRGTSPSDNASVRSKGIVVDIPAGTVFGMYIRVESAGQTEMPTSIYHKWLNYSQAELNSSTYRSSTWGDSKEYILEACKDKSLAAVYNVGDYTYFSFEDWNPDNDLNDMVFMFGGNVPTPTDEDAVEWLVACEDRSSTKGDNDFNDFVFKVSHATEATSINVTPLAAVGTYKSELYYTDPDDNTALVGEVHELINPNAQADANGLYSIINGESMDEYGPGAIRTLKVASTFSMEEFTPSQYTTTTEVNKMGGFQIKSYREDQDGTGDVFVPIVAPNRGDAPAMFCVPATWTVSAGVKAAWVWPKEGHGISSAYPDFSTWVTNHSTGQDWYKNRVDAEVVSGNYLTMVEQGSAQGSLNELKFDLILDVTSISLGIDQTEFVNITTNSTGDITVINATTNVVEVTQTGKTIKVKGVGAGDATLTVHVDANGRYGEQNATIKVKVYAQSNDFAFTEDVTEGVSLTLGGAAKELTYSSSSDGDISLLSYDNTYVTATLDKSNNKLTIAPTSLGGPTTISLKQDASGDYPERIIRVLVNVEAPAEKILTDLGDYSMGWSETGAYHYAIDPSEISAGCKIKLTFGEGSASNPYADMRYTNGNSNSTQWTATTTITQDMINTFENNKSEDKYHIYLVTWHGTTISKASIEEAAQ